MKEETFKSIFKTSKPIIGMAHFRALPGSPLYDKEAGINGIIKSLENDLVALQEGGIDAIMFGNENDRPYQLKANPATIATMSYIIGKLSPAIRVPFGVDVLWDPIATLAVAKATGAKFAREIFTGIFAGDLGLWNTDCGETFRFRRIIDADDIILLFNINAEFSTTLETRPLEETAKSVAFSSLPDIICVSGGITGGEVSLSTLKKIKETIPDTKVFANTGVTVGNIEQIIKVVDGVVVGTSLKRDGITWNDVEKERVINLMRKAKKAQGSN